MATEVIFPLLGLSTKGGQIKKWLKAEGDVLQKGEAIAEIETEKVVIEVESPASGTLSKILVPVNVAVPTFTVIGVITAAGEELPPKYLSAMPPPQAVSEEESGNRAEGPGPVLEKQVAAQRLAAVPLVRKLASEHGVDLVLVKGTGPGGRISKEDVLRYIQESKATGAAAVAGAQPDREATVPLSPMRQVIAKRMTESFETPHFYLTVEIDCKQMVEERNRLAKPVKEETGIGLTYTDLIIKATARALEENPAMNCAYSSGSVRVIKRIDIGLVVSVEGGLLVPVVRQANKKTLPEITRARDDVIQKARSRKLGGDEIAGSTFTISNLGMFGIDQFQAILNPPEAGILAIGRIADKPVVRDGQIVVRPMMTLTLSIDHRVLDGVIGANFLQSLKKYLETPGALS